MGFKKFLCEQSLSVANFKLNPDRLYTFREKVLNGSPFETTTGNVIVLNTGDNINAIDNISKGKPIKGFKFQTDAGELSLNAFYKTSEFGGLSGSTNKKSAGLDNEQVFIDTINQFTASGPINIIFKSKNKKFVVKNVIKANGVGTHTAGGKKSDVDLITLSKTVPISIKKDNAEYWESGDRNMGGIARKVLIKAQNDGIIKLSHEHNGITKMSNNIAFEATTAEKKAVVFGSDIIKGQGAIIQKTFTPHSFELVGSDLIINCSEIITSLKDLNHTNNVWFLIRQDRSRNNKSLGFRGLRILAAYEKRIGKTVIRVKR